MEPAKTRAPFPYIIAAVVVGGLFGFLLAHIGKTRSVPVVIEQANVEAEKISHTTTETKKTGEATRVTITTKPVDRSQMRGAYLHDRDYEFTNGVFSVSFTYASQFFDQYSDPAASDLLHYGISFFRNAQGPGQEVFLQIDVTNSDYCLERMCEYESKEMVDVFGAEWVYVGETEYCDVGECSGYPYTYIKEHGDIQARIGSLDPLHGEDASTYWDTKTILGTLKINPADRSR